jgi:tetratricopeptide (TPR) repeat protein
VLLFAMAIVPGCGLGGPDLTPGEILYNQGKYGEALPLLREQEGSKRTGTLLYQLGYCVLAVEGDRAKRQVLWEAAVPLLEQELSAPQGVTLERLYYLAAIHMSNGDHDAMRRFARRAVDEIELGPEMAQLDGEAWFRLARIHDWLNEPSEAEAAYRRAVSAFRADGPADNPAYQSLALARVADLDFSNLRYESAVINYDDAFKLVPESGEIRAFNHGLSLLAVGRFAEARDRFMADQDPKTKEESILAAGIARMCEEAGPLIEDDFDGMRLGSMAIGTLHNRVLESAGAFMQVRNRYSYKPGDPLVPDLVDKQKRFISLVREWLIRKREIQAFLDGEGLAELVRP